MAVKSFSSLTTNPNPGYLYVETIYFTSSGTFSKSSYSWLRAIRVKTLGGGGAGGGAATTTAGQVSRGGGGGGGGYAETFITDIAGLSSSVTVTIGAGGTGVSGAGGNAGGQSSFGALCVASGGSGGSLDGAKEAAIPSLGGAAGIGTTGDLLGAGHRGRLGFSFATNAFRGASGDGGPSMLGGGGLGVGYSGSNPSAGVGFGGGGGGAYNEASIGTAKTGASGSSGIVIVELYA
jgi:hypothetical protein